jgi:hypothetical protein
MQKAGGRHGMAPDPNAASGSSGAQWWTEHLTNIDILARKLNELQAAFEDVWESRGAPKSAAVFVHAGHSEGCDLFFSPAAARLLPTCYGRPRMPCTPPRATEVRLLAGAEEAIGLLPE